jgi:nucleolar protein 53
MAEPSILPPQQHSQPSRKGKKAWRKNVDITDIQSGLEEVREQLIKGGIVSEKPSSELFTTDIVGSDAIRTKHNVGRKLKADEILAQRSVVPSVSTHRRPTTGEIEVERRITDGIVRDAKRQKRDYVGYKEYERLRKIAYGGDTQHRNIVKAHEDGASYDPWDSLGTNSNNKAGNGWIEEKRPVKEPVTLKRKPVSLAKNGRDLPAVLKPDAGKSYNPTFADWNNLIQREGTKEVETEKARQEEARRDRKIQELREKAKREEEMEQAGYGSNWESEWESEWEGIMSENEEKEWLSRKRPERKTKAERNKIARRKEEERKKLHEESRKKHEQQVTQIEQIAQEQTLAEMERQKKLQLQRMEVESSEDEAELELRKRRFGTHSVPEMPLEVVLADELQDSLRLLKPEGDLLQGRFRSMMVRGKLETRKKITQHKKPNRKATEKWSYKDWKLK